MKRDTGKRGCSAGRGRPAPGADPSGAGRTLGISSSQTPLSRSGRLSVSYRTSSFSHLNAVSFLVFATYETEIPRLARESLWPLRKKSVLTLHCRLYGEAISAIDRLRRRPVETRPPRSRQTRFEVPASRTPEPQAAGAGQGPPPSARGGGWASSFTRNQSEAGCFQLVNTTTRSPRSTEPSSGGCCGSAAFWMQLHGGQKPPRRTCPVG